jgi:hypothetical protein
MIKVALKIFVLCLIAVSFAGCSDDDVDKVDVTFSPDNPRVNFQNKNLFLYTDGDGNPVVEEVKGPWFKTNVSVSNNSSKGVVISKMEFKVTGISTMGGGFQSASIDFEADSLLGNKNQDATDDTDVLLALAAGQTGEITDVYISELPPTVTTGVFSVEVTVSGWFGTAESATDVFIQKYFFTTNN